MRWFIASFSFMTLLSTHAIADCKGEVAAAFEKQRKMSGFRMETNMVSEEGPIKMTVDYLLPDRMRQKVINITAQKETETLLVGSSAWAKQDSDWMELPTEAVTEIMEHITATVVDPPKEIAEYACAGKMSFEGKEYFAYKVDASGQKVKNAASDPTNPSRLLYVDPITGLPALSLVALAGREDKPFFKTVYSYPVDLKIEAPPAK